MRTIDEIIIHCSETPAGRKVTVDEIRKWHTLSPPKGNGWKDIGYHFVVYLDGSIHQGRPLDEVGAHCKNHNARSIGICYVGGVKDNKPCDTRTKSQIKAIRRLVDSLKTVFPTIERVSGHSDYANKNCPCFNVNTEL